MNEKRFERFRLLPLTNCYECPHYDYDTKNGKPTVQCELQQKYDQWVYVKKGEYDINVLFPTCPLQPDPSNEEYEGIKQQLREIHHYYADSGSDQKGAKRIVKVLEEHFEWLKPKDD
jgi:hypothetical protein